MELQLRLRLYKRRFLVRRSVTSTLLSTETSMSGLTLILITLEEPQLRNRLKLLKIFSNIVLIMDSLMKMTSNNYFVKHASFHLLIDMSMVNAHFVNILMLEVINATDVES